MQKYITIIFMFSTFIFAVVSFGETPDIGEISPDPEVDASLFDNAERVFEIGVITNVGTYYERQGDEYIVTELPEPGSFGAVLARTPYNSGDNEPDYYYVQGRGWEGWVDRRYFESTGMPLSGEINTARLNVRSEPSAKSEVAGQVVEGDRVFVYERSENKETIGGDSGYWYRIGEGEWVFGAYVDLFSTYDSIWLLNSPGIAPAKIAPEAIEAVVNGIINAPPRPFSFGLPPEWDDANPNVPVENASYQSQALYWAAQRLLGSSDEESLKWAAFYAGQLGEYYPDSNVYGWEFGFKHPAAAEAARLQIKAYARTDDREHFEETVMEAFPEFGSIRYFSYSYGSFYGLQMLYEISDYISGWVPSEAADLLLELAEIAPNRLLKAVAELDAGKLLVASSSETDIAKGQNLLWAVIEEYPDQEHNPLYVTFNAGQVALVEYLRSLPDDERRRAFLEKYTGDATPFPVRYCALYLLSYGDDGYDADTAFGPLDTGYRELYDSIQLENKDYWFTWNK